MTNFIKFMKMKKWQANSAARPKTKCPGAIAARGAPGEVARCRGCGTGSFLVRSFLVMYTPNTETAHLWANTLTQSQEWF